jgi:hypothetical protein
LGEGPGADETDTPPHSVGFAQGGPGTDSEPEGCITASDWVTAVSDNEDSGDDGNDSDKNSGSGLDLDKLEDDLALPRLEDSQRILDVALEEIRFGHVPTVSRHVTRLYDFHFIYHMYYTSWSCDLTTFHFAHESCSHMTHPLHSHTTHYESLLTSQVTHRTLLSDSDSCFHPLFRDLIPRTLLSL